MAEAKTKTESKTTARRERKPLHKRRILDVPESYKKPGFHYRWVNEGIGAVEAYEEAGYKVVLEKDVKPETKRTQDASQLGSVVRRVVNKDPAAAVNTAVLMMIPMEFYLEDKAAIHAELDEQEKAYDPEAVAKRDAGFYGHSETKNDTKKSG